MLNRSEAYNDSEEIFKMFTSFISICMFSYVIAHVRRIVLILAEKDNRFKKDLEVIQRYLKLVGLKDKELKLKFISHLYYTYSNENQLQEAEKEI